MYSVDPDKDPEAGGALSYARLSSAKKWSGKKHFWPEEWSGNSRTGRTADGGLVCWVLIGNQTVNFFIKIKSDDCKEKLRLTKISLISVFAIRSVGYSFRSSSEYTHSMFQLFACLVLFHAF